jgi:NAD(P)-dependent dehydrogenase (short-subunit alcohol dehydrogenase family)
MADRLAGKTAIVTGAGRGIGAAIARIFAAEGAAVVVAEKDPQTGRSVAAEITAGGGRACFVETDVTEPDMVAAMLAATVAAFGPPAVLVNNAGVNVFHEPLETSEAEWRRCFSVDLDAAWSCARAVLPGMIEAGRGSIVNIARHALVGLTRALAIEYAARGIRVNAIAPGYIETQIAVDYWNTFPDPEAERRRTYALHPPQRIGRPQEVAWTAVFLASDEAPFINAETIVIDGGRSVLYHE